MIKIRKTFVPAKYCQILQIQNLQEDVWENLLYLYTLVYLLWKLLVQFANKFILHISQACRSKTTMKQSKKTKTEKEGTLSTSKSILSTFCPIKICCC